MAGSRYVVVEIGSQPLAASGPYRKLQGEPLEFGSGAGNFDGRPSGIWRYGWGYTRGLMGTQGRRRLDARFPVIFPTSRTQGRPIWYTWGIYREISISRGRNRRFREAPTRPAPQIILYGRDMLSPPMISPYFP